MYTNEHAGRLAALKFKSSTIERDIQKLKSDSNWYEAFDSEAINSQFLQSKRLTIEIKKRLEKLDQTIKSTSKEVEQCRTVSGGFFSSIWRSSAQKVAQLRIQELEHRLGLLSRQHSEARSELALHEPVERRLEADLTRYRDFDPLEAGPAIAVLTAKLQEVEEQIEKTRIASDRWEAMMGMAVGEWQHYKFQLDNIKIDIETAKNFKDRLANARDKQERFHIHQECEEVLQSGSPGSVLSELEKDSREIERNIKKVEGRLKSIMLLMDKKIDTLIIDGNNLCYIQQEKGKGSFVGLAPLKSLVQELSRLYKITILFDPGIRGLVSKNESQLQAEFPQAVVKIMHGAAADEGLMAAAAFDRNAYIISNDNFRDYQDQPAFKEGRILKHMIYASSIQVQALQVNVGY